MNSKAFFRARCALVLLLAVSGLANCGGNSSTGQLPPPPPSNQVPTISLLAPSCAPAGEPLPLTVVGLNFVASSVVQWNGSDQPTTSNGSFNGLIAQISASDVASAGTAAVRVFNPGSGGGSSNSLTFTITTGAVDPQSIAVDPAGNFAYVMNGGCRAALVATCPCTRSTPRPEP